MRTKPVVRIIFSNGVGNNIFQYIYARLLAEEREMELSHPDLPVLGIKGKEIPFNDDFPTVIVTWNSKTGGDYEKLIHKKEQVNLNLRIYPEDFLVYRKRLHQIRSWFPPPVEKNTKDLVFHLRLGDRLVMRSTYKDDNTVPAAQFKRAIDSFDFDRLHVVTDMPIWREIAPEDIDKMIFHRGVPEEKRINSRISAEYFNTLFRMLQQYNPLVRVGNSVESDFEYMRQFEKVLLQHGTLSWWAATLGHSKEVAVYGKWRSGKEINLGWTDFPGWRQWGPLTAPSRQVKEFHLLSLADQYGLKVFVETGTKGGTTLLSFVDKFSMLYSVEIVKDAYIAAAHKLKSHSNVRILHGDSAKKLPEILDKVQEPALFWLDAHDNKKSTPILGELKEILVHPFNHVIVIDDWRYFVGEFIYPSEEEIRYMVRSARPNSIVDVKFDTIRIFLK